MPRSSRLPLIALACALCTAHAHAEARITAAHGLASYSAAFAEDGGRSAPKPSASPIIGEIEPFTEARSIAPAEGVVFINEGDAPPPPDAPAAAYESAPAETTEFYEPGPSPAPYPPAYPDTEMDRTESEPSAPMWQPEPEDLTSGGLTQPPAASPYTISSSAPPALASQPVLPAPAAQGTDAVMSITATAADTSAAAPTKTRSVLEGIQLYLVGDYASALPILREHAMGGDPRSRQLYGIALFNGEGGPADRAAGMAWTRIAADTGVDAARGNLAAMEAQATPQERAQADTLYRQLQRSASPPRTPTIARTEDRKAPQPAPAAAPAPKPKPKVAAAKPTAAPSPRPAQAVSGTGSWKLLLGAFANPSNAAQLQTKLRARPEIRSYRLGTSAYGKLTSVSASGYSESAARRACASLKAAGFACVASGG